MRRLACLLAGLVLIGCSAAEASDRLSDIRNRGTLHCGVWPHVAGFATEHDGDYHGFEIDLCRAIAAAVLGDASRVSFVALEHVSQFAAQEDVDLAIRRLTWTPSRETDTGIVFGPVVFYDGQGFLVPKDIQHPSQLAGERVCVINRERHPRTLHDYNPDIRLVIVDSDEQAEAALLGKRCRAYSADVSSLAAARSTFADGVDRYAILPDLISKEPLAPLIRAEDRGLLHQVRWTIFAMIEAEERGVTSRNTEPSDPAHTIIQGVGNYGEVFGRNLGTDSPLKMDRGLNGLWRHGGLLYAPPLDR